MSADEVDMLPSDVDNVRHLLVIALNVSAALNLPENIDNARARDHLHNAALEISCALEHIDPGLEVEEKHDCAFAREGD